MAEYQIVTDSTTDLSADLVRELDLQVLPLRYMIDGKTYHNIPGGGELSDKEFFQLMRQGKMCTTSQVNVEDFVTCFTAILEQGRDVLYLAFSSGLSGTYQSAQIAKQDLADKYPDRRIEVFDTLSASLGEGLLVYHAVKLKAAGKSMDEVLAWLEENRLHLCHWFTVDDLNHLKRGGRVSAATALVGTALGIKPVMHVDDEGHLINVSKARGRRRSLDALVERMEASAIDPKNQTVFICHGDCHDDVVYLTKQMKEKMGVKDVYSNFIGPVIGAHAGPGTVAVFFLGTQR